MAEEPRDALLSLKISVWCSPSRLTFNILDGSTSRISESLSQPPLLVCGSNFDIPGMGEAAAPPDAARMSISATFCDWIALSAAIGGDSKGVVVVGVIRDWLKLARRIRNVTDLASDIIGALLAVNNEQPAAIDRKSVV